MNISNLNRLKNIFESKSWLADDEDNGLLDKFCAILESSDDKEQDLILCLTADFEWYNLNHYRKLIYQVVSKITHVLSNQYSQIIILPVFNKKDIERSEIKSSHAVIYSFREVIKKKISNGQIKAIEHYSILNTTYINRENALIIFVDDFIGSGDTVVDCLDNFETFRKHSDSILILSLVAMQQGLDLINDKGFEVYSGHIMKRGISDSQSISDRDAAKLLMEGIENRIGIGSMYRFGWKQCEALVSMERTPNNTFPIYWSTKNSWQAQFPR